MTLLVYIDAARGMQQRALMADRVPGQGIFLQGEAHDPAEVRHILTWLVPNDLDRFPNLATVFSVGAGVDQFLGTRLGG